MKAVSMGTANKKIMKGRLKWQRIFLFTMLVIPLMHFCVFYIYMNSRFITMAFQSRTGTWTLDNFKKFFEAAGRDGDIGIAVKNTILFYLFGQISLPSGLIISYFLFKKIRGYKFFRFAFYFPGILAEIVMVTLFKEFVKPWGPVGVIFENLGHPFPLEGLFATESATMTIIIYTVWLSLPSGMMLWMGSMTRIPQDVFEAAKIDGCGTFRELWSIIIPLIFPTVASMFLIAMTGFLGAGGPILLFTDGRYGTSTFGFWMFKQVYKGPGGQSGTDFYGVLSATGLFFTAALVPLVFFVRWLLNKIPSAEY